MRNRYPATKLVTMSLILGSALMSASQAAEFFVDGNTGADTNAGTATSPWKTITKANQVLVAGDTVNIRAGNYTSFVAPVNSGTSAKPITYKGAGVVNIANTTNGVVISGKSFIVVDGGDKTKFKVSNVDKFLTITNSATNNTVKNISFIQGKTMGWAGAEISRSSTSNKIQNNTFAKYGKITTSATGSVMDIGNEESQTDLTANNLIENNEFFHGGHHVLGVYGKFTIVRNNFFRNDAWSNAHGSRIIYVNGYAANSGWNLIEGNRVGYAAVNHQPDLNSSGMLLANNNNIVRKNDFFYNNGSGLAMTLTANYISNIQNNSIYNNTFLNNGFKSTYIPDATAAGIAFGQYGGPWVISKNKVKNNLLMETQNQITHFGFYRVNKLEQSIINNLEHPRDDLVVNNLVNVADYINTPNLNLKGTATTNPAINKGVGLTTISSASGTGTTFQVADAGYFTDGFGLVPGDDIQIVGATTTQKAKITKVAYATNTITVASAITWVKGQGLSLAFAGTAPDMGAHESGATAAAAAAIVEPPTQLTVSQ